MSLKELTVKQTLLSAIFRTPSTSVAYNVSVMLFKSRADHILGSGNMSGVTKLRIKTSKALKSTGMAISRTVWKG